MSRKRRQWSADSPVVIKYLDGLPLEQLALEENYKDPKYVYKVLGSAIPRHRTSHRLAKAHALEFMRRKLADGKKVTLGELQARFGLYRRAAVVARRAAKQEEEFR